MQEFYISSPFNNEELVYEKSKNVKDDYILIETKELISIYEKVNYRKTIFKYLTYIISNKANKMNIDGKSKGSFYFTKSRTELSINFSVDKRTIDNYNNLLVQADILYIIKSTYKWKDNNRIVNNFYGLMIDKEYIDNAYKNFVNKYKNNLERI
jgi:hypothetical protein